ncbi:DUF6722 family protein [Duncaniella muris]|uniref:DUF6722 family protein n=2 Tax=Duncaniella muris TaxID=2094150 RepID=UPI0034CEB223
MDSMRKEFGKWLMDIAKYITTAVILSSVFGEVETWIIYVIGAVSVIVTLCWGLYLVDDKHAAKKQNNRYNKK